MPDALFDDPRLAVLYDVVDADRRDLDVYVELVEKLGVSSVLDVGCGTGVLACMLAARGFEVTGLDPAAASLEVAGGRPGADRVRWIQNDAAGAPPLGVDVALMTGNVAQVFLTDADWSATLTALRSAICDGGWLVFETRDPRRRAWERWTRSHTYRELHVADVGRVTTWTELVAVAEPFVTFRHVFEFEHDGSELVSESTLRFRDRDEITADLSEAGFDVVEVRDAPDRPGLEHVFLSSRRRRSPAHGGP